jgi:cellulose synthase/poly-beta-1,6-N-acetylglucosamine synthase-like glycosyltransferase
MTAAAWAFWLSMAFLLYVYMGFALLVAVVGYWRHRAVRTAPIVPRVSLIIAAYNEEHVIGDRVDNALALDYPPHALEIIVASDGSTDATEAIVARYASWGVRLLSLPRQGKIRALDAAVIEATGEILVFSDANTMCARNALRALVRNFADAAIGGVAGHTGYRLEANTQSSARGESLYWSYDSWLKHLESLTGSIVSAHGGLYAVRRALYRPSADPAVTDDFAISTAVIEQGYRLVFDGDALAFETAVPEAQREFGRRVRLMTRGLRGVVMRRGLLNPFRYGFYSVVLFSHKVARRLAPVALVILAASNAALWDAGPVYRAMAVGQLLFYLTALAGLLLRRVRLGSLKVIYVPFFYCMANLAAAVALIQLLRGRRIAHWQPQRNAAATRNA